MCNLKEKIFSYIEAKNITKAEFERTAGLSNGYLNNFKGNMSSQKLEGILFAYPDLSREWLLFGEGSMLKSGGSEAEEVGGSPLVNIREADGISLPRIVDEGEPVGRPYYDVDFMGGFGEFLDDPSIQPLYYIDYRPFNKEGVTWVNVYGDSMSPELRPGDTIALKPVRDWADFLLYNRVYAIVTTSGQRAIKYIQKGDDEHHFSLVSVNPDYEPQQIPKRVITAVFEVLGGFKFFG